MNAGKQVCVDIQLQLSSTFGLLQGLAWEVLQTIFYVGIKGQKDFQPKYYPQNPLDDHALLENFQNISCKKFEKKGKLDTLDIQVLKEMSEEWMMKIHTMPEKFAILRAALDKDAQQSLIQVTSQTFWTHLMQIFGGEGPCISEKKFNEFIASHRMISYRMF